MRSLSRLGNIFISRVLRRKSYKNPSQTQTPPDATFSRVYIYIIKSCYFIVIVIENPASVASGVCLASVSIISSFNKKDITTKHNWSYSSSSSARIREYPVIPPIILTSFPSIFFVFTSNSFKFLFHFIPILLNSFVISTLL